VTTPPEDAPHDPFSTSAGEVLSSYDSTVVPATPPRRRSVVPLLLVLVLLVVGAAGYAA
jgi:hypothetical protein